MPLAFKENFGDKVTVIVDCFEVAVERRSFKKASAESWSNYKHANTIKYLIGISLQGSVMYISHAYGGRASDKFVTENCGFLDNLQNGDVILADRGFFISEAVRAHGASLCLPAFTKRRSQLHPLEIEDTRNIANVRIHVERVIGLLRSKYRILNQRKFLLMALTRKTVDGQSTVDLMVRLCCVLINFCNPICVSACSDEDGDL